MLKSIIHGSVLLTNASTHSGTPQAECTWRGVVNKSMGGDKLKQQHYNEDKR